MTRLGILISLLIILLVATLAIYFIWAIWANGAANPENWPQTLSQRGAASRTKRYLRRRGWKLLRGLEWLNISVRAEKGPLQLILIINDGSGAGLGTVIRDAYETSLRLKTVLGILTTNTKDCTPFLDMPGASIFLITPMELPLVDEILLAAYERYKRHKMALPDDEMPTSDDELPAVQDEQCSSIEAPASERNGQGDRAVELAYSNGKTGGTGHRAIRGYVERVTPSRVGGWAFWPEMPSAHARIEVLNCGTEIGIALANRFRPDLKAAGIGDGDHCFIIEFDSDALEVSLTSIQIRAAFVEGPEETIPILPGAVRHGSKTAERSHGGSEHLANTEPVRLVIWDLDDTFWRGTFSEGGITEYVQAHHDIVVELAKRGIMSSICSKNDLAAITEILREKQILDYFVFPSISWDPKGSRIAALIATTQLRPTTVMFIDDNPGNRAEAAQAVPGLQVADETFIGRMLDDPRFKGKNDKELRRLAQYKLMEARKHDAEQTPGNNEAFLRSCDIRVCIDYDVGSHLERAIELINRTNQLNFTKRRLPDDVGAAKNALLKSLNSFAHQSGLIRVADKYGDYGFVGFFETETLRSEYIPGSANRTLRHFCFSCRTLGMFLEQWLYEYLGRPQLQVTGEVLTDLSVPRNIDWFRLVPEIADDVKQFRQVAPELRLYGGCEVNAVGVYLNAYSKHVEILGNFRAGNLFVRINGASVALSIFDRSTIDFAEEAKALSLPCNLVAGDFFATARTGAVFIFSCGLDAGNSPRYRHRITGWEIVIEPINHPGLDFNALAADELSACLEPLRRLNVDDTSNIVRAANHIRAHYETLRGQSDAERMEAMRALIARVPAGSKFVLLLDDERVRGPDGTLQATPWVTKYNRLVKSVVADFSYAAAVSFSDFIDNEDQIQIGGNHYDRLIYARVAERLVGVIDGLVAK